MSEVKPTMATPSIVELMQAMFMQMRDSINDNNLTINNDINNIKNNINNKIDTMHALNHATRMKILELIDQRSRKSTRASTIT